MRIDYNDYDPQITITFAEAEFKTLDTIAGIGACTFIEEGTLSPSGIDYDAIRSQFVVARQRLTPEHGIGLELPVGNRIKLLGDIAHRGALIHARNQMIPLSKLSPETNTGLHVVHGIRVAQTAGWLGSRDAIDNLTLFNAQPHDPVLLWGEGPATNEQITEMVQARHIHAPRS